MVKESVRTGGREEAGAWLSSVRQVKDADLSQMKGAAWGRQEGGGPGLIRGIVVASVGDGAKDRAEPEWECHFFLVSEDTFIMDASS